MNKNLEILWKKIETSSKLYTSEYKAISTDIKTKEGKEIFIAIDTHSNKRHLLIPVLDGNFADDVKSRGVHILCQKSNLEGKEVYFIDLVCHLDHLKELMNIVIIEILKKLKEDNKNPYKTCKIVIDQWRELIGKTRSHILSEKKLQGLFGELWYLRKLIEIDLIAIDYWKGPLSEPHDFLNKNIAIEVKTTAKKGRFFSINGIEQLKVPSDGELYLCAIKLKKVESGGYSVPELIESIIDKGINLSKLLALLTEIGYFIADIKYYKQKRYEIIENRVYEVDEKFPKIIWESFKNNKLPENIIDIKYIIDLNSEPPLPLTEIETKNVLERFCS